MQQNVLRVAKGAHKIGFHTFNHNALKNFETDYSCQNAEFRKSLRIHKTKIRSTLTPTA